MERWKKVLANALVTGAIVSLSLLATLPAESLTLPVFYSVTLAGAISALREYQEHAREKRERGKRVKDTRPVMLEMATIF